MALLFNAAADEVQHGSGVGIGSANAFTMLAWIYPTNISATFRQIVGNKSDTTTDQRIATSDGSGVGRIRFLANYTSTNADAISANNTIVVNAWNFVAFRFDEADSQSARMYRGDLSNMATEVTYSGTPVEPSGTIRTPVGNFVVGHEAITNLYPYIGRIAIVQFFPNTALTLGEIQSLQVRPRMFTGCEIFSHYGFNGTGTQPDWSGNGNDGTVTGTTEVDHVPIVPFPLPLTRFSLSLFAGGTPATGSFVASNADVLPGSVNVGGTPATASWTSVNASVAATSFVGGTVAPAAWSSINADVAPGQVAVGGTVATAIWSATNADAKLILFAGGTVSVATWAAANADVIPGPTSAGGTPSSAVWSAIDASVSSIQFVGGTVATGTWASVNADVAPGQVVVGGTVAVAAWAASDATVQLVLFAGGAVSVSTWSSINADVNPGDAIVGGTVEAAAWSAIDASVRPAQVAGGTPATASWAATNANVAAGSTTAGGLPSVATWIAVDADTVPSGKIDNPWSPAILFGDETTR